jgi:L-seryl-tRNA(Ser) seleniumtransferase
MARRRSVEASAALSMLLLTDHGMLMAHFVGLPPGTVDLLIKFVPSETLECFLGFVEFPGAQRRIFG